MPTCIVYAYASCTGQLHQAHGFAQIGIRAVMPACAGSEIETVRWLPLATDGKV